MNHTKSILFAALVLAAIALFIIQPTPTAKAADVLSLGGSYTTLISGETIQGGSTNSAGWVTFGIPTQKDLAFQLSYYNSNTITAGTSNITAVVQHSNDAANWDPTQQNVFALGGRGSALKAVTVTNFTSQSWAFVRVYLTNANDVNMGLVTNCTLRVFAK